MVWFVSWGYKQAFLCGEDKKILFMYVFANFKKGYHLVHLIKNVPIGIILLYIVHSPLIPSIQKVHFG